MRIQKHPTIEKIFRQSNEKQALSGFKIFTGTTEQLIRQLSPTLTTMPEMSLLQEGDDMGH